ncbi:MAG: phosphoenolpyruvate carboxykinase [Proteobacteria bacterium]|nr:phosphoenolpyruvate carboxykinase [Pseudomonadota bacterium]
MHQVGPIVSSFGLEHHGLHNCGVAHWNFHPAGLYEESVRRRECVLSREGVLVAHTGVHTGRSPRDKYIVEEPKTRAQVWWSNVNRPLAEDKFEGLLRRVQDYAQERDLFVRDCYAGADPRYRLKVRVISEHAWHNLFAHNMFIVPEAKDLEGFVPEFTIYHMPGCRAVPAVDGTNSESFIVLHFSRRVALIGGTSYAGEIKKSIFSVLNFQLPAMGVLPMHCSANTGKAGDVALFFGLSGTGKTTLSADGARTLIGDDEHGWSEHGVFNFEGGCYAKVIRLSAEAEPEIYAASTRFGTILENVVVDMDTRALDLDDDSLTENTRSSYPLAYIPNASTTGMGGHPRNLVMLTADAFGVLPPISRLTPEQAMYHFLSGYTARVAGTEKGVKEPQATFSTCFGEPFMPRHPTVYAEMLGKMIAHHGTRCWLVNTGWSGGRFGVGSRMKIAHTRAMVRAALAGKLDAVPTARDPIFGLNIPESCSEVPASVLNPRNTWSDKGAYDSAAREVAKRFETNFKKFEDQVGDDIKRVAIRAAA